MRSGDKQYQGNVKLRMGQCPPSSGKGFVLEKTPIVCVCVVCLHTSVCFMYVCMFVCACCVLVRKVVVGITD